ncbi:MFS transporter [Cellulophaga baltica]|uniref:MFS transporter n=1 Tax=Cellulophaga baltica TaxID=76594 RepID=UPI0015F52D59|nr:MFS transporter [Cellulophaga baltica]MBA6315536.1 MFS transporter [Cellulophaga baltica]
MKLKGLRWWVVSLVALAAVINYIDRQAFGALWPDIANELFPEMDKDGHKAIYGTISTIFILSYAGGQALFGKIFDWIGTRIGFALSIGVWSMATLLHAFAQGMLSFSIFRSILGIAEAGNWPGAAKANAEWFPTNERALAQGIFNSGAAIGGIVAYPVIGLLSYYFDWKAIFIVVAILGFLWLLPWLFVVKADPKSHPWLSDDEKKYILSGQRNQDIDDDGNYDEGYTPTTAQLFKHKESWGVIIASAAIDPIWWLFIVWIPLYLSEVFGMDVEQIAFSAWVPYVGAMIGAIFGGLLAKNRIKAGWSVDKTRKLTITLGIALMIPCFILLKYPGAPQVLKVFGVQEVAALKMADPQVKKIMDNKAFKDLKSDKDFIEGIAGNSTNEIKSNPRFKKAYQSAVWKTPKAEATKEERLMPKYGPPSDFGIAALASLSEINKARNTAALIAVIIMAILLFGFQVAIGNIQTLPSDLFGGKIVGTLSGFAGMAAKLGAAGLTLLVTFITTGGNYTPAFLIGGALAIVALSAVWFLCPKIEPLKPKLKA